MEEKSRLYRMIEPSHAVRDRIMAAVFLEESQASAKKRIISIAYLTLSLIALIGTGLWAYADMKQSGFVQALSLVFSDSTLVATYWTDFLSAIAETLPYMSLAACLLSACLVLMSVRSFVISKIHYQHHLKPYVG
jgi:hypothetical protein